MAHNDFLTPALKDMGLVFAREYGEKNEELWQPVIFGGEKSLGNI